MVIFIIILIDLYHVIGWHISCKEPGLRVLCVYTNKNSLLFLRMFILLLHSAASSTGMGDDEVEVSEAPASSGGKYVRNYSTDPKCGVCGGWAVGLVNPSIGVCNHCQRGAADGHGHSHSGGDEGKIWTYSYRI